MAAQVVTMAYTDGACAEEVGREAATLLGFHYINREVISMAAARAHVTPSEIEQVEHTQSVAERIVAAIRGLGPSASYETANPDEDYLQPSNKMWAAPAQGGGDREALYKHFIRQVMWEIGRAGKVLIGAHGASINLATMPAVMRVFITGSADTRAARLAQKEDLSEGEAKRKLAHADRQRALYLRRFYDVRQELPTHYDLVVNTDVLPVAAAAFAIVHAAQAMV